MMARTERKAIPEGLWIAGLQMVTDMNIRGSAIAEDI